MFSWGLLKHAAPVSPVGGATTQDGLVGGASPSMEPAPWAWQCRFSRSGRDQRRRLRLELVWRRWEKGPRPSPMAAGELHTALSFASEGKGSPARSGAHGAAPPNHVVPSPGTFFLSSPTSVWGGVLRSWKGGLLELPRILLEPGTEQEGLCVVTWGHLRSHETVHKLGVSTLEKVRRRLLFEGAPEVTE